MVDLRFWFPTRQGRLHLKLCASPGMVRSTLEVIMGDIAVTSPYPQLVLLLPSFPQYPYFAF